MTKYIDLLRAHQHKKNITFKTSDEPSSPPQTKSGDDTLDHSLDADWLPEDSPVEARTTDNTPETLLLDENLNGEPSNTALKQDTPTFNEHSEQNDWLSTCVEHITLIFQLAEQNSAANITPLSNYLDELLAQLEHDQEESIINELELNIAQQTQAIRDSHPELGSLIQKSVMMMLYGIKSGKRLKLSNHELRIQTLACMLHHIGMAQIPASIRNKKEKLTSDELAQIHQSPQLGINFFELSGISEQSILDATSQASERYDGSGAKGLLGSNIAWSARLTGVLSMFEALIHYRPYRARLLPRDAIREMVKNHKQSFDPAMLKALIESISLYPIGTYVQLNSGDVGLVIHVHPRLPLRPIVDIRMDKHGNPIPPRQVNLQKQPNLMIERCMYEEALDELDEEKRKRHH